MPNPLIDYYKCPEHVVGFEIPDVLSENEGYFRLGAQCLVYGRTTSGQLSTESSATTPDLWSEISVDEGKVRLPFDPAEIVHNLRNERYVFNHNGEGIGRSLGKAAYYWLRPLLSMHLRAYVKRAALSGWKRTAFPRWPVDRTADIVQQQLLLLSMKAKVLTQVPFIWFWPRGHAGCIVVTHDVETSKGLDFCSSLMNLNEKHDIKSSFQLIPRGEYRVSSSVISRFISRGFEVNVHDWNHDGQLFSSRDLFLERVNEINDFGVQWGSQGFRSGALYRNQEWFDALSFSYDMSVPNVGHLDPQPGGCCTLMPYFIGNILEIPLTTTQDYMLFHLLNNYSIDLWKEELDLILQNYGLATFIIHPDYIVERRARDVYMQLLSELSQRRSIQNAWIALPGEVNRWWRDRQNMRLVSTTRGWDIQGPGSENACIAYATVADDQLCYILHGDQHCASPLLMDAEIAAPLNSDATFAKTNNKV